MWLDLFEAVEMCGPSEGCGGMKPLALTALVLLSLRITYIKYTEQLWSSKKFLENRSLSETSKTLKIITMKNNILKGSLGGLLEHATR